MNHLTSYSFALAVLVLPALVAAQQPPPPPPPVAPPHPQRQIRFQAFPVISAAMEKGTMLGVSTAPVPEPLRAQVDLGGPFGLVVEHVVTDSPAAKAGVQIHDILYKFGEHVLVNHEQLAALVQSHKPGDQVELTLYRKSKAETVTVTLAEGNVRPPIGFPHPPPPVSHGSRGDALWARLHGAPPTPADNVNVRFMRLGGHDELVRNLEKHLDELDGRTEPIPVEEVRGHMKNLIEHLKEGGPPQLRFHGVPGGGHTDPKLHQHLRELHEKMRRLHEQRGEQDKGREQMAEAIVELKLALEMAKRDVEEATSRQRTLSLVYDDGDHSLSVTEGEAGKRLVAKDKAGDVLYNGPINTKEQLAALPAVVRDKLRELESKVDAELRDER